ncbi:MAG: hypothetical protein OEW21_19210 [Betaproteobacteria bacterium]|nr:hypothetical protein [Betaproteobacteria bacterium]
MRRDPATGFSAGSGGIAAFSLALESALAGLPPDGEQRYSCAFIVPRRLAPGRDIRWISWALAPMLATYRQFGLPAYLNESEVWMHGRRITRSSACVMGECAVIAANFMLRVEAPFDGAGVSPGFRPWLRSELSLAESECGDVGPVARLLEDVLRQRIEAQWGWQFEHSWPSEIEKKAIETLRGRAVLESAA